MWLLVGLGNPGPEYEAHRHNVGFRVIDELLARAKAPAPRSKFGADCSEATLAGNRAIFCKPMEFMNVSGQAVARVGRFFKVPLAQTVVVHDDMDLPLGRLKLGTGGGAGGHNGLKSLIASLGSPDFARVRVGVGRPPAGRDPADWVLSGFSKAEQKELPFVVGEAADAVEAVVAQGIATAMNKFNQRKSNTGASA